MKAIINEVAEKLKHEFITFFSEEEKGLVEAERYFSRRIADATLELLRVYYEEMDRRLLEYDAKTGAVSCEGLRRELYLLWVNQSRGGAELTSDLTGLAPLPEREEMRALAHLYRRFEQEMGRPLRYSESDQLRCWVEDEQEPPELIEEALKRAALRDKCTMSYIGSILKNWKSKGLTTLSMVLEKDRPEEKDQSSREPEPAEKKSIKKTSKYGNVKIN